MTLWHFLLKSGNLKYPVLNAAIAGIIWNLFSL